MTQDIGAVALGPVAAETVVTFKKDEAVLIATLLIKAAAADKDRDTARSAFTKLVRAVQSTSEPKP